MIHSVHPLINPKPFQLTPESLKVQYVELSDESRVLCDLIRSISDR